MNLIFNVKVTRHAEATEITGEGVEPPIGVDTANFHALMFVIVLGLITPGAGGSVRLQQSDAIDGIGDPFTDIPAVQVGVAQGSDQKIFLVEVSGTSKRFIKCIIDRDMGFGKLDCILAIQAGGSHLPVNQGVTVGSAQHHVDPDAVAT